MKKLFLLAIAFLPILISGKDYQIDFAVYGDHENLPDSVIVQNLDHGQVLSLGGHDVLHLVASTTGTADPGTAREKVEIYPNPFSDKTTIVFTNRQSGAVKLTLFDITGSLVTKKGMFQSQGKAMAEVKGLHPGAYLLRIDTESDMYSRVILSYGGSGDSPEISFTGSVPSDGTPVSFLKSYKKSDGLVDMQYNEGDSLFFTAYLGELQSEIKIVPVVSTTLTFDFQQDREDITDNAEITVNGGVLRITDESGNGITVNFPPGAVMDTISVSMTLPGKPKTLPIDEWQVRSFKITPLDIELYQPVIITVDYNESINELQKSTLFLVQEGSRLLPLSNHFYNTDSMSVIARTFQLGEFAEGRMSLEQINTQFDLLVSDLGINRTGTTKAAENEKKAFTGENSQKQTWDIWRQVAGGFVTFFNLKELYGFYDNSQTSRQSDQEILCEVMNTTVKEILDLPIPQDPCDYNYTYTILSMILDMEQYGCTSAEEYSRLVERYNQTLATCGSENPETKTDSFPDSFNSYLTIIMEVEIESGGLEMFTLGDVPIYSTKDTIGGANVTGGGTLEVTGSASAGGPCTGEITGETEVMIYGYRDSLNTYMLTMLTYQTALLATRCPDGSTTQTPLEGPGNQSIILNLWNNFDFSKEETFGESNYIYEVVMRNPYINLPVSE